MESAVIAVNGGDLCVQASDDGINVAGGADSSSVDGRPGQNDFTPSENNKFFINGGRLVVDADGDGVDCNGRIEMTDGILIVNGPTNDGNGALDYLGDFEVTGGYIVAAGSSGMAQAPNETSTQYSVLVNFTSAQAAGTMVHIETADGTEVLTFVPTKQFQSIVLCSAQLQNGMSYKVYLGGSSTGDVVDSLYSGGSYTPGEENATFTISDVVTLVGQSGGGAPGGAGRRRGGTSGGADPAGVPDGTGTRAMPGVTTSTA